MKTEVFFRLQLEGLHFWPGATELPEVAYLANPHRHVFHVSGTHAVTHDDRDVEFIMVQHQVREAFKQFWDDDLLLYNFGKMSCEAIGSWLMTLFPFTSIEVSEDGENGARLTR